MLQQISSLICISVFLCCRIPVCKQEESGKGELLQDAHETSYNANPTLPWSENLQYHDPYIFLKDQRHILSYFSAFKKWKQI